MQSIRLDQREMVIDISQDKKFHFLYVTIKSKIVTKGESRMRSE